MYLTIFNVMLNIIIIISMLMLAASGKRPDLVYHINDNGTIQDTSISKGYYKCPCIDGEDQPNKIWATAILASGIYLIVTGNTGPKNNACRWFELSNISVVSIYLCIIVYCHYIILKENNLEKSPGRVISTTKNARFVLSVFRPRYTMSQAVQPHAIVL